MALFVASFLLGMFGYFVVRLYAELQAIYIESQQTAVR